MRKKDIYIQDDQSSCGAVCIQSVVSHFGGYVPLETVLKDTLTDRNGTNAYQLVLALKKYGIEAYGMNIILEKLENVSLPVIAHTAKDGYEHFIVIYEIDKKQEKVVVMDPASGKKVYSFNDFKSIFDNKIVMLNKRGEIPKYKRSTSLLMLLFEIFSANKKTVFINFLLNIVLIVLSLISSFHLKILSSGIDPYGITLIFVLLNLLSFSFSKIKIEIEERFLKTVDDKATKKFVEHIFSLPQKYLTNKRVGEIMKKIEGMGFLKELTTRIAMVNSIDLIMIGCSIILMFNISLKISLLIIIYLIIYITITPFYETRLFKRSKKNIGLYEHYSGSLVEALEGLESIKNLNEEERFLTALENSYRNLTEDTRKLNILSREKNAYKSYLFDLMTIAIGLLGFLNFSILFSYYDLILCISLFSLICQSLESISYSYSSFIKGKVLFRSISEFLDIENDRCSSSLQLDFKRLEISNLSYSYDNYYYKVKDFSLVINRGDKYLLKGPSGIGKSTLVKCIAGRYDGYDGKILIDGIDVSKKSVSLRNYIVYVGQEERLFSGTIRENIEGSVRNEELYKKVVSLTELEEVFESRIQGADTSILEGATNISGGEKARIYLARALLKNPSILIVDETLSAVGEEMENRILERLIAEEDLTMIYITHRNKEKLFKKKITFRKEGKYDIE